MRLEPRELLIALSLKYKGDWQQIYDAIYRKEDINAEQAKEEIEKLNCRTITIVDPEYPLSLKNIFKPPFVLYCYGDITLLKGYSNNLAVVGAREPSDYARKNVVKIIKDIALDFPVVSGCALGIDGLAQQTCIDAGGRTIGVLGCGIDVIHPKTNTALIKEIAKNHLLVSEYPPQTEPTKDKFTSRNRIVVGLTLHVLIFDVKKDSGTHNSFSLSVLNNRNLMSIPYPIGTEYLNNQFIKEGITLIEDGDDIRYLIEKFGK